MRKPLRVGKTEFRLLEVFDIEVNADPIEQRSIVRPERFGATDTPAVSSLRVTYSVRVLTCGAGSETVTLRISKVIPIAGANP
jgi:hypothetical protein